MIKVLLVDDDPVLSQMLDDELVKKGYLVSHAGTGKAGIQAAKTESPDCVILDHILPDMLGIQVLQALRADDATKSVPIIFYTSTNDDALKEQVLQSGATRFFLKFSTDIPTLVETVHEVL